MSLRPRAHRGVGERVAIPPSGTAFLPRLDRDEWPLRFLTLASRVRIPIQRTLSGDSAIAPHRQGMERAGGYGEGLLMEDVEPSRSLCDSSACCEPFPRASPPLPAGSNVALLFMGCLHGSCSRAYEETGECGGRWW